jgi:hypothetical protein
MPAESYLVTRYAKPKQRCHRKQADQRPIEEPITAGLFRFLEASTDERVSKTNERVDMTMMHGRVNKITKRGFLFLDACDGGLDVFVSDKIADRSGDKFAIGEDTPSIFTSASPVRRTVPNARRNRRRKRATAAGMNSRAGVQLSCLLAAQGNDRGRL